MAESVSAVCFPRDDQQFARSVHVLVVLGGEPVMAAVQALLREAYPLAVVSARHPLASFDGRRVWYAFRDGRMVATPVDTAGAPGDGSSP